MHSDLISTASGYQVPVRWYHQSGARGNIIFMAALGTPAGYYGPLAEALSGIGLNVLLLEQRGHGDSALRASRNVDFGFREALAEDIPQSMEWVSKQTPGLPLYLMGHSLGGHYAAITAGRFPQQVAGIILTACGSPWYGGFHGRIRRQLRLLCRLVPVFNLLLGYYPGDRVGFGGREARTLMSDWVDLARTNVYSARGLDEDLEQGIAAYRGPVLSLRLADDAYAPEAAMAAVTDKFINAPVTRQVISAQELGDRADHTRWARKPEALMDHILAWL